METIWKVLSCSFFLLFLELCNGLPLDLDHSADAHTQYLTGLIAVLLTICGVVCLAGCLCCQRKNGFKEFRDSPVVISVASDLNDPGHENPIAANGEFTIFTPLSPPHHNNNVFFANQQVFVRAEEDYKCGDIDVSSWFGSNEREFPRTKLKYIRELGKGWFGKVVEGTAQDLTENGVWTPVVVRILEASASSRQRVLFLHDAAIYRSPSHPNILRLLGRSLESVPLLLLQEYCPRGDLKLYLRQQQTKKEAFLNSDLPLHWCYQLVSAIKHLHKCSIPHPDLAVRNCQLTQDLTLKIGDYGYSMTDYPEDYYHGTENVPIRWSAPECISYTATTIQTKKVTTGGNIWSLGVCFWEIFECGAQPYSNLSDDEVVSQVLGPPHIRLPKPSLINVYTDYIYRLMQLCWSSHDVRPVITQIDFIITDLKKANENSKNSADSLQDFNSRWNNLKPNTIPVTDNHIKNDLTNITVLNMNFNSKPESNILSASMSNLAGSFENLLDKSLGLDDSSDVSTKHEEFEKLEFKLGPLARTSSSSETEDETWRKKIERGAYTEKVRIKSRSVADLMVLTHIDYSESDSETPLPSLDFRFNYKNVRCTPKQNLENTSLMCGSEGNLLSVQDTFQEELKKLQEERKDSLLFVPDKVKDGRSDIPASELLADLNSTATIQPQSQIFNVYNVVTISPKYSPIHKTDLSHIINFNEETLPKENSMILPDLVLNTIETKRDVPKLSEIIENNIELMDYIIAKYDEDAGEEIIEISNPKIEDISKNEDDDCQVLDNKNNIIMNGVELKNTQSTDIAITKEESKCMLNTDVTILKEHEKNSELNVITKNNDQQNHINAFEEEINNCKNYEEDVGYVSRQSSNDENSFPSHNYFTEITQVFQKTDQTALSQSIKKENGANIVNNTSNNNNKPNSSNKSPKIDKNLIVKTQDFINNEILSYEDSNVSNDDFIVKFDLSENQEELSNNHPIFTSTPFRRTQSEESSVILGASDDYSIEYYSGLKTSLNDSGKTNIIENKSKTGELNYSLETWDNFLGRSFDEHHSFDGFSSEPQSLLFLENQKEQEATPNINLNIKNEESLDTDAHATFAINTNTTFAIKADATYEVECIVDETKENCDENKFGDELLENKACWDNENESSGGWFLHPQSNSEDISGQIEVSEDDSYVGFSMDDEIMAAIRNELLTKLPQAQRASNEQFEEPEEYETTERNEVFLKYNFYTSLSPIPEESCSELLQSGQSTPHCTINTDLGDSDSEWSDGGLGLNSFRDDESHSPRLLESPHKSLNNVHTQSQESCCSNDTLFNLDDLQLLEKHCEVEESPVNSTFIVKVEENSENNGVDLVNTFKPDSPIMGIDDFKIDKNENIKIVISSENENIDSLPSSLDITTIKIVNERVNNENAIGNETRKTYQNILESPKQITEEFLKREKCEFVGTNITVTRKETEESSSSSETYLTASENGYVLQNIAPLNSPEDRPWKHIEASLSKCTKIPESDGDVIEANDTIEIIYTFVDDNNKIRDAAGETTNEYENIQEMNMKNKLVSSQADYVNMDNDIFNCLETNVTYEDEKQNDAVGYVNEVPLNKSEDEYCKIHEYVNNEIPKNIYENLDYADYVNSDNGELQYDNLDHRNSVEIEDVYGPLTDIRFTGPSDSQMMTTSFSESNDLGDDQDWDSGSDTRSSSSGEFIWKEGEHEASVKALHAAPQDDDNQQSETSQVEDETSSESEEEGDGPEFVPSAWDKFAAPTKSALRSPEKTLVKCEKKSRGVSFKKQKYHCVYEYPREPESPIIQTYELFQEPTYSVGSSILDDDFYISSSSRPFDVFGTSTSQFFPGRHCEWSEIIKNNDNVTPDSGVEDTTPGSLSDSSDYVRLPRNVLPLKTLAQLVVNKGNHSKNSEIGGLRHTRNRLKLDLPPSPSAFTKTFSIEPSIDPILSRQVPTFTTFGKSRFVVQQVDTPSDDHNNAKNVSFEALPYKPMKTHIYKDDDINLEKQRVEIVRGEASLLDSADEDSGIETCTLERKNVL